MMQTPVDLAITRVRNRIVAARSEESHGGPDRSERLAQLRAELHRLEEEKKAEASVDVDR